MVNLIYPNSKQELWIIWKTSKNSAYFITLASVQICFFPMNHRYVLIENVFTFVLFSAIITSKFHIFSTLGFTQMSQKRFSPWIFFMTDLAFVWLKRIHTLVVPRSIHEVIMKARIRILKIWNSVLIYGQIWKIEFMYFQMCILRIFYYSLMIVFFNFWFSFSRP